VGAFSAPGIAVAVATLDRPDLLARCLDAVLSGETVPAEVVVVDQGSHPHTPAVVAERGRDIPVAYVHQERDGLSASRNAALETARAQVLVTTDDDCVPAPGWLAAIGRTFAEAPAPQSVTGRVLPLGPDRPGFYALSSRTSMARAELSNGAPPWTAGTGANFAVERSWAERIGGWDERLGAGSGGGAGEDVDFLYRLLRAGGRVIYEPDALVYHERHAADRRRATRLSYGRGVGACCGLYLRRRDPGGTRLLAQWTSLRTRMAGRALAHGEWRALGEELLVARGTLAGLVYGLRIGR
jgi:GT2 family glycosyltransferase